MERLQKVIAQSGYCSRRKAEEFIKQGKVYVNGEKVILMKPSTYMNLSGEAIKEARDFYNVKPEEIIVIYDDIDIEKGKIKLRKKGGPGSHNGMKSVVQELNTTDFIRIRKLSSSIAIMPL